MRGLLYSACALVCACASARPERMRFAEVWGTSGSEAPPREAPAAQGAFATPSRELEAALVAFGARARIARSASAAGAAMPAEQVRSWSQVLTAVEAFLTRPAAECAAVDVVRAHATLSAELELDARRYGQVPADLAEEVTQGVGRLASRMSEVRRLGVRTRAVAQRFAWPVRPVAVTSLFGPRLHPLTGSWRHHAGIDLAARKGQEVAAAAGGVVVFAGWHGAHGRHVEVQHGRGLVTRYSHLSTVLVEPGFQVKRGDLLGFAGDTGDATGVHLHFELLRDGRPQDPLDELPPLPPPGGPAVAVGRALP